MPTRNDELRAQLLGYLMGALEPREQLQLEARLQEDAEIRQQLEELREHVDLLGEPEPLTPPPGLAERACEFVSFRAHVIAMNQTRVAASKWQLQDMVVAAGVFIAAAMLFFPAVNQSRFASHIASCQNNLRAIGQALMLYSGNNGGYFPYVPSSGNLAVAGIFGPSIVEGGYLTDQQHLVCPESQIIAQQAAQAAQLDAAQNLASKTNEQPVHQQTFRIPQIVEMRRADGQKLRLLQSQAGGSYGYTIGHTLDGRYRGTKNRSRSHFALVADAPQPRMAGDWQSDNHGNCGQNVLYEDLHVKFQRSCRESLDHIYVNDLGLVGPGNHPDDAVICPSGLPASLVELDGPSK